MGLFAKRASAPDLRDFDTAVRFLVAKNAPVGEEVIEGDHDSLLIGSGQLNLGNLRRSWSERPHIERFPWLEGFVMEMFDQHEDVRSQAAVSPPASVPSVPVQSGPDLSKLRLGVRSNALLAQPALMAAAQVGHFDPRAEVPSRTLAGELSWVVIEDHANSMTMVNAGQMEDRSAGFDELFAHAAANMPVEPLQEWSAADNRVYMPVNADDYLAARIFRPGGLDLLPISGERVVFHPTRQTALVASADDPDGIALAATLTRDFAGKAHPLSLLPLVGAGDQWRPFAPEAGHPAWSVCQELAVTNNHLAYAAQQQLLERVVGDQIFVASYKAYQMGDRVVSASAWTSGISILLPKVDYISFVEVNDAGTDTLSPPFFVEWNDVVAICGDRLEPTSYEPARWRVVEFPSPDQLERLRNVQVAFG